MEKGKRGGGRRSDVSLSIFKCAVANFVSITITELKRFDRRSQKQFYFFGCNWTCGQGHVHGETAPLPRGVHNKHSTNFGEFSLSIYIQFTATKYRERGKGGKNIKNRLEGSWLDAANERHKRRFQRVSGRAYKLREGGVLVCVFVAGHVLNGLPRGCET